MIGIILWLVDFLTTTTDKKLDVIIQGIENLLTYAEKNITSEGQRLKWETEVKPLIIKIAEFQGKVSLERSKVIMGGTATLAGEDPDIFGSFKESPDQFMHEKEQREKSYNANLQSIGNFFSNVWSGITDFFKGFPSENDPLLRYGRKDTTSKDSVAKGDVEKFDTNTTLLQQISDKLDNLASGKLSPVTEARADELTDADKGKTASDEGKTTDTAVLDELKLLKESFAAQIASGRAALSEARDQVIFAREAVTTLQTRVATLSVVVTNLKLPKTEEPKINEYVEYQLDSTYRRI